MSSAAATGPLIKPLSMANACLTSLPSIFTTTKTSFSFVSVPSKSLHISCASSSSSSSSGGFPSWVSLKNKNCSSSSSMVAMVSSTTSDWAQTEDSSEVEEDDEAKWENDEGEEEGSSEVVSYSIPPVEAKLFVANLPYDVDSQKLAELFQQAGIVEIAEVIYNRQTDQSRGFAFVTMSTIEEAEKAVEMFNRYDINGRLLTVNKDGERGSRPEQPRRDFQSPLTIYVGNLPWEVDSARLEHVFSDFGKVVDARVLSDRETGRSRGFGFVTMSTQAEVEDAVNALNGQDLDGRTIKVNVSEQRERRGSF